METINKVEDFMQYATSQKWQMVDHHVAVEAWDHNDEVIVENWTFLDLWSDHVGTLEAITFGNGTKEIEWFPRHN